MLMTAARKAARGEEVVVVAPTAAIACEHAREFRHLFPSFILAKISFIYHGGSYFDEHTGTVRGFRGVVLIDHAVKEKIIDKAQRAIDAARTTIAAVEKWK